MPKLRTPGEDVSARGMAPIKRLSVGLRLLAVACGCTVIGTCDASNPAKSARGDANTVFAPCSICHAIGPNAAVGVGPPLNGIVGRLWATHATFAYSPGLIAGRESGRRWDEATLDAGIEKPRSVVADTKMMFPGLADRKARQAIIAYLRRFNETGQAPGD